MAAIFRKLRWWRRCWIPSRKTTFKIHLKNGRSSRNFAYAQKGDCFDCDVGQ
jgi:hypothetical protein